MKKLTKITVLEEHDMLDSPKKPASITTYSCAARLERKPVLQCLNCASCELDGYRLCSFHFFREKRARRNK